MKLKEIHKLLVDMVALLQKKTAEHSKIKNPKPEEIKFIEYAKGQYYEAQYLLEKVEEIIYETRW